MNYLSLLLDLDTKKALKKELDPYFIALGACILLRGSSNTLEDGLNAARYLLEKAKGE